MSIRRKAYKYLLMPNSEQRMYFHKCFNGVRFIYNKMLSERIELYAAYRDNMDEFRAHKPKTYSQLKREYPWLYEIDNQALANAQMQLRVAYSNYFRSPTIGFPKFRNKKSGKNTFTTNNNATKNIRIENNHVHLPKIGWIKIRYHRCIPSDHTIKAATIGRSPSGRYYISILTEYDWEQPVVDLSQDRALGLDYSSPHFYVDSQGVKADMPHFYREAESKLAREVQKLCNMKIGGANYNKQRRKVAMYHDRVANCRKDWLHKRSSELADKWDYICVEDINLREMAGSLKFGKSTHDNGFGEFRLLLEYKLYERGKMFIKIDKWFPSSKKCSECGEINSELTLKTREWTCICGSHHDRDLNAAINIRNVGLAMIG